MNRRQAENPRRPARAAPLLRACAGAALLALAGCGGRDPAPQPISRTGGGAAGLACLQEAIYFEAGGTGEAGRRAVGYVILNRAADPRFPSSICGVVHEGEGNGSGCQFSYRCDGRAERIRDPYEYRKSGETARLVLSAKERDITGGALFFHAASMPPGWFATRQRTGRFGGNIFYR